MNYLNYPSDFNYLDGIVSLTRFFRSQQEVAVYALGSLGENFLDFLQYSGNLKYFCCVVTDETKGNNTEQKFSHFLPVMPLEMLVHMKDTALILVAAPQDRHDEIRRCLDEFDFKQVIFLADKIHDLIKKDLLRRKESGQIISWFSNHVMEELKEIDYLIAEQHSIAELHTKTFAEYKNCFYGKKVAIVANGPTMKYYKPMPDAIHIGVNRTFLREDIPIDYHFFIDNNSLDDRVDLVHGLSKIKGKIFWGQNPIRATVNSSVAPENFYLDHNISKFYSTPPMRYRDTVPLHVDICNHILTGLISVTTIALRFALWTYPEKIYLVGCDTTSEGHFFDEEDEVTLGIPRLHQLKVMFGRIKMFARCHYPNTEFISVNPIGLKGLFTDIYTDEYLQTL